MTKRRDVVRFLMAHGFRSVKGTNHEKFTNGRVTVLVARHREIRDSIFEKIKKQAGLK